MTQQTLPEESSDYSPNRKQTRNYNIKTCFTLLFVFVQFTISSNLFAATITTTGSGNWSSTVPNAPWPSGIIPASTDNIIIGNGFTLTVNGNRTCNSMSFDNSTSGVARGTLTVNAGFLLTVTADLSCPALGFPTKVNGNYNISGAGGITAASFNCNNGEAPNGSGSTAISVISTINALTIAGDLTIYSTYTPGGNKYNNASLNIQAGTVTVRGNLTTINSSAANESVLDLVTSASNPTLVLGGATPLNLSATGINTVNLNGSGATVNYNRAGAQTVPALPYINLTLSGSGTKTLAPAFLPIASDFTLAGTASATASSGLTVGGNVSIGTGTTFNGGAFTHNVTGTWTNNGTVNPGTSTVNLNGSALQQIAGTATSTFNNLTVSNPAGVSLAAPVKVNSLLSFGNVNNSTISTNGLLTFASTASAEGMLKDLTNGGVNSGNSITGNVTVEVYIQGKRSYRFLSAPVNSSTSIRANWMENTNNTSTTVNNNPVANYGTHITGTGGSANGFDATGTNNPSLFTFNNTTQAWVAVPNTNGLLTAGTAYRIMVRGNRSVNLNDNYAVPSATTLRATGALVTGTVTMAKAGAGGTPGMPQLTSVSGAYSFVANPYASAVNWLNIDRTDISSTFYVYDPTISGSNGRGAYVAYNGALNANSTVNSAITNHIQAGQAFFVETTGPNPSITFRETAKSTTGNGVFRSAANDVANMSIQLLLPSQVGTTGIADGAKVYFSDDYKAAIGDEDSYKFTNLDENIGIMVNNKTLSIEGRKPVYSADSVQLKMWQLTQSNYTLKIAFENFPDNVEGYLQDSYLHTAIPLHSNAETLVPFSITADAASVANNRFTIVFETLATLPVRLTGVKAYVKNKGVEVEWVAESESNMDLYEVQRSTDAQHFETIGAAKAKNNPGLSAAYNFFDVSPVAGNDYYRIKSIDKSGMVTFTEVVKVNRIESDRGISVFPNPVRGNTINILFTNLPAATYNVSLVNNAGQIVFSGNVAHNGVSAYHAIAIPSLLVKGIYELHASSGGAVYNFGVSIQ